MWTNNPLITPLVSLAGLTSVVAAQLDPAGGGAAAAAAMNNNPAAAPAAAAPAVGAPPVAITSLVSTWWNWTYYLEPQRNVKLAFSPGNAPAKSKNSTKTTGLNVGVVVNDARRYQKMKGLGVSVTDATSIVLSDLKKSRPETYREVLNLLYNPSQEWIERGGLGADMVRVPIGASDFGYQQYTFDDTEDGTPDPSLSKFDMDKSPKVWSTLADIRALQPHLKVFPAPWSPPAWVKGNYNGSLVGGSVLPQYEDAYANYFLKTVQGYDRRGLRPYILSLQNNPNMVTPRAPSTNMDPDQEARLGKKVRKLLDDNGFQDVKLGAYDFDWENAQYPVQVFDQAKDAFGAVLWHCHGTGLPVNQTVFSTAYPGVETHMTECTQTTNNFNEPWQNLRSQMERLVFGSVRYGSQSIVLWNGVLLTNLDGFTQPHVPHPKTCRHCLAPVLVWPNASTTGELPQGDGTEVPGAKRLAMRGMRRRDAVQPVPTDDMATASSSSSSSQAPHPFAAQVTEADVGYVASPGTQVDGGAMAMAMAAPAPASSGSQSSNGIGSAQTGMSISPNRDYYKLTSDWVTLHHFGRAIRPVQVGGEYATLTSTTTTEDDSMYPRVYAQTYALDGANERNQTRFTMLLFQRNDHLGTGLFEDATVTIEFRNQTTNLTVPPGVYTLEWYA